MTVAERAKKIKFLITDVDGVLTDGKINLFINHKGERDEFKQFAAVDGIGAMLLRDADIGCGIITGGVHPTTVERAKMLGMLYIYQGFIDKLTSFEDLLKREKIKPEEAAYIGDDIIDLPLLTRVGLAVCPADARPETKKYCHLVSSYAGGNGVLRETADIILKAQGKWAKLEEYIKHGRWDRKLKVPTQVFTKEGRH